MRPVVLLRYPDRARGAEYPGKQRIRGCSLQGSDGGFCFVFHIININVARRGLEAVIHATKLRLAVGEIIKD